MNISNNKSIHSPQFKAKTTINAPEALLSKKDKEELIRQGHQIGTDKDIIEISLSNLKPNYFNKNILGYDLRKKIELKSPKKIIIEDTKSTLPHIIDGIPLQLTNPQYYISKMLNSLAQLFLD